MDSLWKKLVLQGFRLHPVFRPRLTGGCRAQLLARPLSARLRVRLSVLLTALLWLLGVVTSLPVSARASTPLSAQSAGSGISENPAAEVEVLALINRERGQAGAGRLQPDAQLAGAARGHAIRMAELRSVAHQLPGEATLSQRLHTADVRFTQAAENLVMAHSVAEADQAFLASPPHRENLMDPAYDSAGIAVIERDGLLYITEDFARHILNAEPTQTTAAELKPAISSPVPSPGQVVLFEQALAERIEQIRSRSHLPSLQLLQDEAHKGAMQQATCDMASSGKLQIELPKGLGLPQISSTYTSSQPQHLPESAVLAVMRKPLRQYYVGVCFAPSASYPEGVYWVALLLYE